MLSDLIRISTKWRRLEGFHDVNGGVTATRNSADQVAANDVR